MKNNRLNWSVGRIINKNVKQRGRASRVLSAHGCIQPVTLVVQALGTPAGEEDGWETQCPQE